LAPTQVVDRVRPLLSQAGVTRMANITGLDCIGIHTVAAMRPDATTLSVSAGKGLTLEAAMASAAMEAIELFSAETAEIPRVVCPPRDLPQSQPAVDLDQLPLRPHALVMTHLPMAWTFGLDLVRESSVALPMALVTLRDAFDLTNPFQTTSNGLGAGTALAEAVLVGLLEVVERDAVACHRITARNRNTGLPRVDTESLRAMPLVDELRRQIAHAGGEVVVYDCTSDVGIPVYLARLFDARHRYTGVYSGSGAHLDPEIAIVRAITEAAQSRVVYLAGARDDVSGRAFAQHRAHDSPSIVSALREQPATVDVSNVRSHASATFEADISYVLHGLEGIGIGTCVVVDLTPTVFRSSLSVVRVVVPGLFGLDEQVGVRSHRVERFVRQLAA
jgi:ribosomal protein S12 methylthiotransferase accessory factor